MNRNLLTADEARAEWIELDRWVTWLSRTYDLPTSVVPPFWYRHPKLLARFAAGRTRRELTALYGVSESTIRRALKD